MSDFTTIKQAILAAKLDRAEMTILKEMLESEINFEDEQEALFRLPTGRRPLCYEQFKEIRRALVSQGINVSAQPSISYHEGIMSWTIAKSGDTSNRATLQLSPDRQWTIERIKGKERVSVGAINLHAYLKRASVNVAAFGGYNIK